VTSYTSGDVFKVLPDISKDTSFSDSSPSSLIYIYMGSVKAVNFVISYTSVNFF